jgi:hypothetical protein
LSATAGYIRIKSVPAGEAPQWVREKWVGLVLPLATWRRRPFTATTSGVLSGPPNRLAALWWGLRGRLKRQSGYAVYASEALAILERTAPDAAAWWRENVPRLQAGPRKFLFRTSDCQLLAGP